MGRMMVGRAPQECFFAVVTKREGEAGSVGLGERGHCHPSHLSHCPRAPALSWLTSLAAALSLFSSGLRPRTQRGHLNLPLPCLLFFLPQLDSSLLAVSCLKPPKRKFT